MQTLRIPFRLAVLPMLLAIILATRRRFQGTYYTHALILLFIAIIIRSLFNSYLRSLNYTVRTNLAVPIEKFSFARGEEFELPCGRMLGYKKYGAKGVDILRTIIYFHGTPGSRHELYP